MRLLKVALLIVPCCWYPGQHPGDSVIDGLQNPRPGIEPGASPTTWIIKATFLHEKRRSFTPRVASPRFGNPRACIPTQGDRPTLLTGFGSSGLWLVSSVYRTDGLILRGTTTTHYVINTHSLRVITRRVFGTPGTHHTLFLSRRTCGVCA